MPRAGVPVRKDDEGSLVNSKSAALLQVPAF
jgi:hypothetical protein